MATDVKNIAGGDPGNSSNGGIVVKANRNTTQTLAPPGGDIEYLIAKFDLKYTDTADPADGADLADRIDDPRYYQGDLVT